MQTWLPVKSYPCHFALFQLVPMGRRTVAMVRVDVCTTYGGVYNVRHVNSSLFAGVIACRRSADFSISSCFKLFNRAR